MTYPDVFIVGAARTPIGKFLGGLASLKASDLGAVAIREAMGRAGVGGGEVDEVLMGHVVQGGQGQAPARQALIKAGIDPKVGAVTINKVCGSGLKAVMIGAAAIKAGDAHTIVAGGQESMSSAPITCSAGAPARSSATPRCATAWSTTGCGARSTTAT